MQAPTTVLLDPALTSSQHFGDILMAWDRLSAKSPCSVTNSFSPGEGSKQKNPAIRDPECRMWHCELPMPEAKIFLCSSLNVRATN